MVNELKSRIDTAKDFIDTKRRESPGIWMIYITLFYLKQQKIIWMLLKICKHDKNVNTWEFCLYDAYFSLFTNSNRQDNLWKLNLEQNSKSSAND